MCVETGAGRACQAQVVIEQFHGIAIQWQHANLFAFARDPDLRIRELDVLAAECQDFA
jgi:hypothetical protein